MSVTAAYLSQSLATFRSQALTSLIGTASGAGQSATEGGAPDFSALLANKVGDVQGLSGAGRNPALYDPESAYKMMSVINGNDVLYKAQFSELSQMESWVAQMENAGQKLSGIDASTGDQEIASRVQEFVAQYNGWVERFNPDMQRGGVLADTQAAQLARHELKESIRNIFNGARDGVHGLADLGIAIDEKSGAASFDSARFDSLLATNRKGAVDALQEFSANFTKSASLLNSDGNIIPNRLDNLSKVIDYFDEHKVSLQNEFGTGDAPRSSGRVAEALAAYNQRYGA
ncbi:MAG: flagellar filament capping protein FliD [Rhodocyclaceae bacterium]